MRRIPALLIALFFVFALFGCGTEGDTPITDAPTTDPATEPVTEPVTEPPAPKEKVIYLAGENGNDDNDGLTPETAVATYEKAFSLLSEAFIHWRTKWQLTPVFLSGKFHGQRSLAGYSPWDKNAINSRQLGK